MALDLESALKRVEATRNRPKKSPAERKRDKLFSQITREGLFMTPEACRLKYQPLVATTINQLREGLEKKAREVSQSEEEFKENYKNLVLKHFG